MSEFRQDISSGDWVIIATGRASRPDMLKKKSEPRKPSPKSTCPFENFQKSGNWPPIASYPEGKDWRVIVIPNKYPAVAEMKVCAESFQEGLYTGKTGVGIHELMVTRDHNKTFSDLSPREAAEVFQAFQDRHRLAAKDPCIIYATTFFNWGASVGGSIWHPHYQFIGLPVIPPHATHSMHGESLYFKKHHRCVRCEILKEERKKKTRIVAENEFAMAITPYASKRPFEVNIIPKAHLSGFDKTPRATLAGIAAVTQTVLRAMKRHAGDPDLNFFIHDEPLDGKSYPYHHWHIEVLPNISRLGGLEFSTGIYINIVDPNAAAAVLRGKTIK